MIRIIAGGKKHQRWLAEAVEEYEKRLRKPYATEWLFVDEEKIAEKVAQLPKSALMILLDEHGAALSSEEFAEKLDGAFMDGREVVIVIGGAFGHFAETVVRRADTVLSLSKMVLPHQLCRAVMIEQIYRAQEIANGGKYHHA
ncbi:23S rRNA (pseudouridine(1915)-N(3))-methyltransferase RlmH [Candidatus Saccharibacteria bacterium]|nr:23S rRNA (pseudouridine(1915)-N(3))-methyltransferase RlmH [Candidatus Saccharibacteria bacterium]